MQFERFTKKNIVWLILLSVWIFTAPMNLFYKMLPNYGFVGGLQIDYLIPKLSIQDVVAIMTVCYWFLIQRLKFFDKTHVFTKHKHSIFFSLSLLALWVMRQFFTPFPISAIWFLISLSVRILAFLVLFQECKALLTHNRRVISAWLTCSLIFTGVFQSTLGLYQFFSQKELLGFLFFGEPSLSKTLAVSRFDWSWLDGMFGTALGLRISPYGTTPHPNILAGFLSLSLLFILYVLLKNKISSLIKCLIILSCLPIVACLLFTQSLTALLSLLIGISGMVISTAIQSSKKIRFLWLCLSIAISSLMLTTMSFALLETTPVNSLSFIRREYLQDAAIHMVIQAPVFGVGINQFTGIVENFLNNQETVRFVQPVHQWFLLFLAENGLFGVALVLLFLLVCFRSSSVSIGLLPFALAFIPLLSFDHYLYSLIVGQSIGLLFVLYTTNVEDQHIRI